MAVPGVGQGLVRLDRQHLAIDPAPIGAEAETVIHGGLEIVLHQPFRDQMRLGERAPDFFRRKRHLPLDDDGARFGRGSLVHPFQQIFELVEPALPEAGHLAGPVDQRRQRAELRAVMGLAAVLAALHQPGLFQNAEMLGDGRLRNLGPRRQGPHRLLAVAAQPLEDRPPGRIGEGPEQCSCAFGISTITRWLWINV